MRRGLGGSVGLPPHDMTAQGLASSLEFLGRNLVKSAGPDAQIVPGSLVLEPDHTDPLFPLVLRIRLEVWA